MHNSNYLRLAIIVICNATIIPIDAIIGARHKQHFIIDDQCNGCELCITECPVDCIEMMPNEKKNSWKV